MSKFQNTTIKDEAEESLLRLDLAECNEENCLIKKELETKIESSDEEEVKIVDNNLHGLNLIIKTIESKNFKYIGEINSENKRHGFGLCIYHRGDQYIGQFSNGEKHGIGKFILKNGEIYQGEFKNDSIDGFMESITKNTIKQGYAKKYIFEGEIFMNNKDNHTIDGVFKNSHGLGKITNFTKNFIYEGEMTKCIQDGYGISNAKDKFVYKGLHLNGKFSGYGELYNPDGGRYFGFYKNNLRKGFGLCFYKDGRVSFGNYIDDIKHGPFLFSLKFATKIEMFNYGFKYKTIEKADTARAYFKTFYPEFDWLFKINLKNLTDIFNDVKTEEFLDVNVIIDANVPVQAAVKFVVSSAKIKEINSNELKIDDNINNIIIASKEKSELKKQESSPELRELN